MRLGFIRCQPVLGTTSIYWTHEQAEAMTLGDKLVVMRDGIAEQVGTPIEVYERPATTYVAGFIGSPAMNFLPGRVDGGSVALNAGPVLPLPNGAGGVEQNGTEWWGERVSPYVLISVGGGSLKKKNKKRNGK